MNRGWLIGISAIALVLGTALAVLFIFNPQQHSFYPRCALNALTGLDCPGCGGLRAMHQLLHGNVAEAFALNPFLFLILPILGLLVLNEAVKSIRGRPLFQVKLPTYLIWVLLIVLILFTVLRNLSFAPFS